MKLIGHNKIYNIIVGKGASKQSVVLDEVGLIRLSYLLQEELHRITLRMKYQFKPDILE